MATFTTLCDETGVHDSASATAVGGYVFNEEGYQRFTKSWRETLLPFEDRGIEFFHAGDCYDRNGKFQLLNSGDRDGLFRSLIALIKTTAKLGVICSLEDQAFATAIRRNKLRAYSGSKYTACALRVLPTVGTCLRELNLDGDVRYLFESGYEYSKEANFMIEQDVRKPDRRKAASYESHAFEPKRAQPAFQAADLFLWLWQKYKREHVKHEYFIELLEPPTVRHIERPVTHLDVGVLAMENMTNRVRSNRNKSPEYDLQTGKVRKYSL
jgi:hypothetical protein